MTDENREPEQWTTKGFLAHFMRINRTMPDRSFAFILGAGASRASGIPAGGELVQKWLEELHQRTDSQDSLSDWATADNLSISGFDYSRKAEFYPQIFERRFQRDPEEGYADLETVMANKEPSFGYSVLANILDQTRHKVVITTNFDNLVADALSIYTRSYPLVCGHESLAGFVRVRLRRPLIAKIHRDLLLAPISDANGVNHLAESWKKALSGLFSSHTPIVLGYGGNDGSLMNFLKDMPTGSIPGGILWCYRRDDGLPGERIRQLVAHHRGAIIPVLGFDDFMLQLNDSLEFDLLADTVKHRAEERAKYYRNQVKEIQCRLETTSGSDTSPEAAEVKQALSNTIARQKDWWAWELKAREAVEPEQKERIYRAGLEQFPDSAELNCNFAIFLECTYKNYPEAENRYRKAIALAPNDAGYNNNLALFLQNIRQKHEDAESFYRKALELDPNNATHTGNFAVFLDTIRHDPKEAERLYRRALELDPNQVNNIGNFALFQLNVLKQPDEAEQLYRKALEIDPNHANNTGNFAWFLENFRKAYDEAESLYRKAIELNPHDGNHIGNLALFMQVIRQNYDEAEHLFQMAVDLDPNHPNHAGNFAFFLNNIRNDYQKAETLYRQSLALDPNNANQTGNFACMQLGRGKIDEAALLAEKAWDLCAGESSHSTAEILLYRGLIARLQAQDDVPSLGRLKTLLIEGFLRGAACYDQLLNMAKSRLSEKDYTFYSALANAIQDAGKISELDQFTFWHELPSIPLRALWAP